MASIKYTGIITKDNGAAFTMAEAVAYITLNYIDPHQHYFIDDRKYWAKPHVNGALLDELGGTYVLEPEAKSVEDYDAYASYDDAYNDGKTSGNAVWLNPDNTIGSVPALIKLPIIIFFLFFTQSNLIAQVVQRSGLPNYIPKTGEAHTFKDTAGVSNIIGKGGVYTYSSASEKAWYGIGVIIQESVPPKEWVVNNVKTYLFTFDWYRPSNQVTYKWIKGAWQNPTNYSIDSLLLSHNRWLGKNTFADSLTAEKGINSKGLIKTKGLTSDTLITTKGMNSEGSSTVAAAVLNGVQADKDTVVTSNFTLDGRYGTVGFDCTSSAKDCVFPATSGTIDWKFNVRNDTGINDLVCKTSSGTVFYTLKSKMTVIFKNINGTFKRIQ